MRITPGDYINLLRVKKVCELLHYTDCSIGDAGIQAGFQTDSALIRNFRKFTGTTPREWRKQTQKEIDNPMNYNISVLKDGEEETIHLYGIRKKFFSDAENDWR